MFIYRQLGIASDTYKLSTHALIVHCNLLKVQAVAAMTPLGTGVACLTQRNMLFEDTFDDTWNILQSQEIFVDDGDRHSAKVVEYQGWNVLKDLHDNSYNVHLKFHRYVAFLLPKIHSINHVLFTHLVIF